MGSFDSTDNRLSENRVAVDSETTVIRPADIRRAAMDLLARREHSYQELHRKLVARFDAHDLIHTELDRLREERLQSDARFADAYIYSRAQRLYGPLRIRIELRERGIADSIIASAMQHIVVDWQANLQTLVSNKFGNVEPSDLKEKAKRLRFLQYRGFVGEDTRTLFD